MGLAERFRLKFAACSFLSIDFIASISDTPIGFYSVMEGMIGDELGEEPAKFASLASLGGVCKKYVATSDQQTNEKKKLEEDPFTIPEMPVLEYGEIRGDFVRAHPDATLADFKEPHKKSLERFGVAT